MEKSVTLEEALKRIEELEKENAELREELEYYGKGSYSAPGESTTPCKRQQRNLFVRVCHKRNT